MRANTERIVRPTFACLAQDLAEAILPGELAIELTVFAQQRRKDPTAVLSSPLGDVSHPVIEKANQLALSAAHDPERIRTLRTHTVYKVKTSALRGALWVDPAGQWWLLAAGRRRDGDNADFYQRMELLEGDAGPLLPTDQDQTYLRMENAFIAECELDRVAQRALLDALLKAAASPQVTYDAEVHGAIVGITIDPDEDTSTLTISFEFKSFDQQDRFPTDLFGYVPGCEKADDWDYIPPFKNGQAPIWYTFVPARWIDWLANAVKLDELMAPTYLLPAKSQTIRFAHQTPASSLKAGLVDGMEVRALCGARFTPSRDPFKYPPCAECETIYQHLAES